MAAEDGCKKHRAILSENLFHNNISDSGRSLHLSKNIKHITEETQLWCGKVNQKSGPEGASQETLENACAPLLPVKLRWAWEILSKWKGALKKKSMPNLWDYSQELIMHCCKRWFSKVLNLLSEHVCKRSVWFLNDFASSSSCCV